MKLQVVIKTTSKVSQETKVSLGVQPGELVASVKERIAEAHELAFVSDQELHYNGALLDDSQKLADVGVIDGGALELFVKATEATLVNQVVSLLQQSGREVAISELGLLYSHKHGVSILQALKTLGFTESVADFLSAQKQVNLTNESVSIASKEQTPNVQPAVQAKSYWTLDDDDEEDDSLVVRSVESLTAQLTELLSAHPGQLPIAELSYLYTARYGIAVEQVMKSIGLPKRQKLKDFVRDAADCFALDGVTVSLRVGEVLAPEEVTEHQRLLKLHERVSSSEFRQQASSTLANVVASLTEAVGPHISQVAAESATSKGTKIVGAKDPVKVTLFTNDCLDDEWSKWLQASLESVHIGLKERLPCDFQVSKICRAADGRCDAFIELQAQGRDGEVMPVQLRIAPTFETHAQALEALAAEEDASRPACSQTALAAQRVLFVKKQPEPVKVTARLLKYWREQQSWTSSTSRPSDWLLELIAIHVAIGHLIPANEGYDQSAALRMAASLMAKFTELQVVWTAPQYGRRLPSAELLAQRPLLLDPVDPFTNVASSGLFDSRELVSNVSKASPSLL